MLKQFFLCCAVVGVSGCDVNLSSLRPVKWATVDVNELRGALKDVIAAENPYPEGLEAVSERSVEFGRMRQQISTLERTASNNCRAKINPRGVQPIPPNIMNGAEAFYKENYQRQNEVDNGYQECVRAIESDQLIADLKKKVDAYNKLYELKQNHDRDRMEKVERRVKDVVADYAKANNYELVVSESSTAVIFNSSEMVVDVTGGVLEKIAR